MPRTNYGHTTDALRTAPDAPRTSYGLTTDMRRTGYGLHMEGERATHGRYTVCGLERVACRAGACVFVGCSFCVRSRPVWRSSCVGSCGVRARRLTGGSPRRRIVEVKHKAVDATRAGHGRDTDCARTGDGRASVRLGRIQLSQDGRRRAVGGLATDEKRTRHGLHTDDSPTDGQRAADGQAMDIRRAADGRAFVCCRHFATFRDGRRHGGLGTGF